MAFDSSKWIAVEAGAIKPRLFLYDNSVDDDVTVAGYFLEASGLVDGTTIRNTGSAVSTWVTVADASIGTAIVDA